MNTLIGSKVPRANKAHRCTGCDSMAIKKGDLYHRQTWVDGTIFTAKLCRDCNWYWQTHDWDEGWGIGDIALDAVLTETRLIAPAEYKIQDTYCY